MMNVWRISNLDAIADIKRGLPSQDLNYVDTNSEGVRLIRINDFKSDSPKYIKETKKTRKLTIRKGDILIAGTGATAGISFLVNEQWEGLPFSYNAPRIRVKEGNSSDYVYYILNSDKIKRQQNKLFTGNAQPFLDTRAIGSFKIPVPPLPEQQRIAEILSTVDAKIEVIDQQITETQELKKGLMQRLLTKGIGHTEFKNSSLGEIPKSWEVVKISRIADVNKDSLPNTTQDDFEFYYIDLSSVKSGIIDFPIEKVKYSDSPSRARRILKKEDVIMATVRPNLLGFGYTNFDTENYICSTGFALLSHKENSNGQFIYQNLYSENVQSQINKLIVGSNYPAINSSDVKNIKIPLPPLSEQNKISEILHSVDEKLNVLIEKKTNYQELKQGLMQKLLTGKLRLNVRENSS